MQHMHASERMNPSKLKLGELIKVSQGWAIRGEMKEVIPIVHFSTALNKLNHQAPVIYLLNTDGAILLHQLTRIDDHQPHVSFQRTAKNTLALNNGAASIELTSNGRVSLKTGKNHLTLDENGNLITQTHSIKMSAQGSMRFSSLQGDINLETK